MRDLIKGLFGARTSLPGGVSKEWVGELKTERGLPADTTAREELTRRLGRLSAARFSVFGK
jgi:hypothetical protein